MIEEGGKTSWFLWLIGVSCLAVIVGAFFSFYFQKDYDFIIEVSCNPIEETCFQRDCSDPNNCPPNGFSLFKRYSLRASDFQLCENEYCASACANGIIKCEQIECEENEILGEFCTSQTVGDTAQEEIMDVVEENIE